MVDSPVTLPAFVIGAAAIIWFLASKLAPSVIGVVGKWWETRTTRRATFNVAHLKSVEEYLVRASVLQEHLRAELGAWGLDEPMDQEQVDMVRTRARDMLDLVDPLLAARHSADMVRDEKLNARLEESRRCNVALIRHVVEGSQAGQTPRGYFEDLQHAQVADQQLADRLRQLQL